MEQLLQRNEKNVLASIDGSERAERRLTTPSNRSQTQLLRCYTWSRRDHRRVISSAASCTRDGCPERQRSLPALLAGESPGLRRRCPRRRQQTTAAHSPTSRLQDVHDATRVVSSDGARNLCGHTPPLRRSRSSSLSQRIRAGWSGIVKRQIIRPIQTALSVLTVGSGQCSRTKSRS